MVFELLQVEVEGAREQEQHQVLAHVPLLVLLGGFVLPPRRPR